MTPPTQGEDRHSEFRSAMFIAQYESVREVVLHARQIQHSIVSWSTAAAGVLLASGAVLAGGGVRNVTAGTSGIAFILLLGVAVPALAASSFNSWIAEVARMRRAAWFLRELEYNLYLTGGVSSWPPFPIYDTVVSRGSDGTGSSVTKVGRLAITYLYVGMYVFASVIGLWALLEFESGTDSWRAMEWGGVCLALIGFVCFGWSVRQGYARARPYGAHHPRVHDQDFLATLFADPA